MLRTDLDHFLDYELAMHKQAAGRGSGTCCCCCFLVAIAERGQLFTRSPSPRVRDAPSSRLRRSGERQDRRLSGLGKRDRASPHASRALVPVSVCVSALRLLLPPFAFIHTPTPPPAAKPTIDPAA